MKAVRFDDFGGPEVLHVAEVPEPHAGAGQVRIAVKAAGINPAEWKIRAGYFQEIMPVQLPSGTGFDAAGIVDEVGDGVMDISIGHAVFGLGQNTVAEFAVLSSWVRKPNSLSFVEAGGYASAVETATRILGMVDLKPGQTILVHGAAGGVGTALMQLARHHGLRVIGTASPAKHAYLKSFGADPISYENGIAAKARAISPHIDAAFDLVGSDVLPELIELVGEPRQVVSIANPKATELGAQASFGNTLPHPEIAFAKAAELSQKGEFRMPVEQVFAPVDAAEAHKRSQSGRVSGKLVVTYEA